MKVCPVCSEMVSAGQGCDRSNCPVQSGTVVVAGSAATVEPGFTGRADRVIQASLDKAEGAARGATRRVASVLLLLFIFILLSWYFFHYQGSTGGGDTNSNQEKFGYPINEFEGRSINRFPDACLGTFETSSRDGQGHIVNTTADIHSSGLVVLQGLPDLPAGALLWNEGMAYEMLESPDRVWFKIQPPQMGEFQLHCLKNEQLIHLMQRNGENIVLNKVDKTPIMLEQPME